jgi:hypothetical protein
MMCDSAGNTPGALVSIDYTNLNFSVCFFFLFLCIPFFHVYFHLFSEPSLEIRLLVPLFQLIIQTSLSQSCVVCMPILIQDNTQMNHFYSFYLIFIIISFLLFFYYLFILLFTNKGLESS